METLRKYICWTYAFISLVCARFALCTILFAIKRQDIGLSSLIFPAALGVFSVIYATAWLTTLREKGSARNWAIAANLTNVSVALWPIFHSHSFSWECQGVLLFVGVLGMAASWEPYKKAGEAEKDNSSLSISGDRTSKVLNKTAGVLIFSLSFAAYLWWMGRLKSAGALAIQNNWYRLFLTLLVMFVITSVHEFGHAAVGLAFGMKLRSFFVGPFQWRISDGKWKFHFSAKGILLPDGVTGLVPTSGYMPRWRYLSMMSAGPLANLLTGFYALRIAVTSANNATVQAGGFLALFGSWSLALAVGNLLPFKIKNGYSDGAIILQFCSAGLMADLQLAMAAVGSSLVTPLRPKDYDIRRIRRASQGIEQGPQALLLRLHAFCHFVDSGKTREAAQALLAAESVYHRSASNISAEMHSVFVFGNAFVRRDAVAARAWWERMQVKNPTRFNASYFRAESALLWIEGDLPAAKKSWEKSNALARILPEAGAYEFERHCCMLLCRALDEALAAKHQSALTVWKADPRLDSVHAGFAC